MGVVLEVLLGSLGVGFFKNFGEIAGVTDRQISAKINVNTKTGKKAPQPLNPATFDPSTTQPLNLSTPQPLNPSTLRPPTRSISEDP